MCDASLQRIPNGHPNVINIEGLLISLLARHTVNPSLIWCSFFLKI
jgi:hypothetical protein